MCQNTLRKLLAPIPIYQYRLDTIYVLSYKRYSGILTDKLDNYVYDKIAFYTIPSLFPRSEQVTEYYKEPGRYLYDLDAPDKS